jgi:hypothetical protein
MAMHLENCFVGTFLNEECHKSKFTKTRGSKALIELSESDFKILL